MSDFKFDGLDKAESKLTRMIEHDYPEAFKAMVVQIAYELQGKVKENTPVDTSWLRDNWYVGDIRKRGHTYYIEVYNNIDYALPVNYGHRGSGGEGFVKGAHMLEISIEEVNKRLSLFMQDWLSNFLNTHEVF